MPDICRFHGVTIYVYAEDHPIPHIHAVYAEHQAQIAINPITIIEGRLPTPIRRRVFRWAQQHQQEIHQAWNRAQQGLPPGKVPPPA